MEQYKYLENLNERKMKLKEYKKLAEEFIKKDTNTVLDNSSGNEQIADNLFDNNPCFYINPTEKLITSSYLKEGESFATVLGSGDFAIDALKQNPKEILAFDINKFQIPVGNLKLLALQKMNYEAYCDFFVDSTSSSWFSPDVYKELIKNCNNEKLSTYWDIIIKQREYEQKKLHNHPYYKALHLKQDEILDQEMRSKNSEIAFNYNIAKYFGIVLSPLLDKILGAKGDKVQNSYLETDDNYNLAKSNLKNIDIKFIKSDICKLKNALLSTKDGKSISFDKIYLSNIPEYLNSNLFLKTVDEQLMPILNKDGEIIFCCQGVSEERLIKNEIEDLREIINIDKSDKCITPALIYQTINDIESFNLLIKNYQLDLAETPIHGRGNGIDSVDTFIKIKRK